MKFIVIAATAVFLLWGTPVLAGPCADADGDIVCDVVDNCLDGPIKGGSNPAQDDTDGDLCGNVCDPDQGQTGVVGFPDIISTINAFGVVSENDKVREPVAGVVGFPDIIDTINWFGTAPGPSATTAGTTACP